MQPFKRQSLNDQLMALLVQAIRSGELAPETKLPPEASLAAMFRVSRNTLRETLKTLEVFGIIESRHGQGTFVSEYALQRIPNIQIIRLLSENQSVQALMDARLVVEPGLAALAAERRTEADITAISESKHIILRSGCEDIRTLFHMQVALAARCDMMSSFLEMLFLQLLHSPYPALQDSVTEDYNAAEIQEHQLILECIVVGDAAGARDRMSRHLKNRFDLIYDRASGTEEGDA